MSTDGIHSPARDIAAELYREHRRKIEAELIRIIEIIEGRVPSNAEIALHGQRATYPDGKSEWKWRGQTILWELPPFYRSD